MEKEQRRSITLRLTDEQLSWLAEVRAYMKREATTAFGAPDVSDRDAVLLLLRAGYQAKKRVLRTPNANDIPATADPPHDPGRARAWPNQ